MSGAEENLEYQEPYQGLSEFDAEVVSERISQALQPALASVSMRVAEAVTEQLRASRDVAVDETVQSSERASREATSDEEVVEDEEAPEDEESVQAAGPADDADSSGSNGAGGDSGGGDDDDSDDQSFLGKASSTLVSSFLDSMRDEGREQIESLIDNGVGMLFSREAQRQVRRMADEALQSTLYESLGSIDDPNERNQIYRDTLTKLRPIVRETIDAMYSTRSREHLRDELHGAVPDLLHGEFGELASVATETLSNVAGDAKDAASNHSGDIINVMQQVSTKLLEEKVQDTAEEKIDPEEIQQNVQEKVLEARDTLQEKVGALQEGIKGAQEQFGGGSAGRGRPGAAPSGQPPFGVPPNGFPPSGKPPSGFPPHGAPPKGTHPAVERHLRERESNGRRNRRRAD